MYKDMEGVYLIDLVHTLEKVTTENSLMDAMDFHKNLPDGKIVSANFLEKCQLIADSFNKAGVFDKKVEITKGNDNGTTFTIYLHWK